MRLSRWFGLSLIAITLLLGGCGDDGGGSEADSFLPPEEVQDSEPEGPLGSAWHYPLSPKHRSIVTYRDQNGSMTTFRGQGAEDPFSKDPTPFPYDFNTYFSRDGNQGSILTLSADLDVSGGYSRVFSLAQATGVMPQTFTLDEPFMGQSKYSGVPSGVVCSSYLTKADAHGLTTSLWMELTGRDESDNTTKRLGRVKLEGSGSDGKLLPKPAFKYKWVADLATVDAPATDMNVAHEMVSRDWDGDGYTDYLVSYISDAKGNYQHDGYIHGNAAKQVALVFVDGRSLYDAGRGNGKVRFWSDKSTELWNGHDSVAGGRTDVKPPNSVRLAIGDMNGDASPEVALYYTKVQLPVWGGRAHNNTLRMLSLRYDGTKPTFTWQKTKNSDVGKWYVQYDSVAVAMGDLDGDGNDELAVLHGNTAALHQSSRLYLDVYDLTDGEFKKIITGVKVGHTAKMPDGTYHSKSTPSVEASIADLDGDGVGELVWIASDPDHSDRLKIAIHKWPTDEVDGATVAALPGNGGGTKTVYDLTDMSPRWTLDKDYIRFSMDTGLFFYPPTPADGDVKLKLRKQIGLVTNATAGIRWGLFGWDADAGLEFLAFGDGKVGPKVGNVVPSLVAADLDQESMVLGQPYSYIVTNNIEPMFIIQAPPKHWDEFTSEDVAYTMDAFSLLDGYSTTLNNEDSTSESTATTTTSTGQWSAAFDFTIRKSNPFKVLPPLLEAGGKVAREKVTEDTARKTEELRTGIEFSAQADDQIRYRRITHKVYRYPVLFPAVHAITDDGSRAFLQYIVPQSVQQSLSPTQGTQLDWYEPWHNGLNLFSYPRTLEGTRDYPQGRETKKVGDPWRDINGIVLARSTDTVIGNPDETKWSFTITDATAKEHLMSTKHTTSGYVNVTPQFDTHVVEFETSFEYDNEHSTATDSITTADHSTLSQVTVKWPGTRDYDSPSERAYWEQQFHADAGVYTSDTGNVSVAYAVSQLYNPYSPNLWGPDSPYSMAADPALNLPRQYQWSFGEWTMPANNPGLTGRVRGLRFLGIKDRVLPRDKVVRANLRVYNYSFVPTGPVTVTFLYEATNGQPDVSKATVLPTTILNPIVSIPGRHKGNSADGYQASDDNWQDLEIDFTTPSGVSTGYLHVVLSTTGGNLNTANDAGNVPVAIQVPTPPKSAVMARVADYHSVAEITSGTLKSLQLVTGSLSVRPLLSDGSLGEETTSLWPGQAAVVQVEVRFDDADGVEADGLVGADVTLLDDKGVVGQRSIPMLLNGRGQTVQMFYTAPTDGGIVPLEMVVTSSSLPPEADYDPEGRSTWTELKVGHP